MSDVAVLLNLTGKINFEVTDPLLSVVNAEEPLLFYDRLSTENFPTDATQCRKHVERLVSSMRNMLEARSLSAKDHNETIRLITVFDLVGGAFQSEDDSMKVFPAQKVRLFREIVLRVFGEDNPLLNRLEYSFIFLSDNTDDQQSNIFYFTLAYDGCSGVKADEWIGRGTIDLEKTKAEVINSLGVPDEEASLSSKEIAPKYRAFAEQLQKVLRAVGKRMAEAGLENEFNALYDDISKGISTVGDFIRFNYETSILWCIAQLLGLKADDFKKDCVFFIVGVERNTVAVRRKSEAFLASLVQLLSTISHNDYKRTFNPVELNVPARLFIINNSRNSDFDTKAFGQLEKMILASGPELEKARWKGDRTVKCMVYSAKNKDPQAVDSHRELNDLFAKQRQELYDSFEKQRKVPFFFGKKIGDWDWYKRVLKCAEAIFHFESINDRPLYDPPKRITDNEMDHKEIEYSYAALENEITTMPKELPEMKKGKDLNDYLVERHKLMESFSAAIEDLKKEMVKLGYFTCLLWIGIFSALGFTLCYAYHFFWFENEDSLWLIAACFGVTAVLFVLSAVIGRACVRSKIREVYNKMDSAYQKMQNNLESYLNDVSERVKQQNEADIVRRNLDEMQSKLDAFYRHNKQVDIWLEHYQGIAIKLATTFELLGIPKSDERIKAEKFDQNDFEMEHSAPLLPQAIRDQFGDMSVVFGNNEIKINNVTSFVHHFRFSEEEQ